MHHALPRIFTVPGKLFSRRQPLRTMTRVILPAALRSVTTTFRLTGNSLTARVVRGGMWLFAGNMLHRTAGLVKIAILGRILSPSDFGLMGIAMLVLQWLDSFTQSGFNTALIRKSDNPRSYFDTAWTVQFLRGSVLALAVLIAAPLAAQFFRNPDATPLIRAVAFLLLLRGLTSPAVVCLRRDLDFRRETFWRLGGAGVGLAAALILAFLCRNVWALVVSVLAGQCAETALSYWVQPYKPKLTIDHAQCRELMQFGQWIFWSNILTFLCTYGDAAMVGKLLGATLLGYYEVAALVAFSLTGQIGVYIRGLMLPALTKLETPEELRRVLLRILHLLLLLVIPVSLFIAVFAQPVIRLAVGDRWISSVPIVRVLVWTGAVNAVAEVLWPVLLRLDRPRTMTTSLFIRLLSFGLVLYPLAKMEGALGVAFAALAGSAGGTLYLLFRVSGALRISARQWIVTLLPSQAAASPFITLWRWVTSTARRRSYFGA